MVVERQFQTRNPSNPIVSDSTSQLKPIKEAHWSLGGVVVAVFVVGVALLRVIII